MTIAAPLPLDPFEVERAVERAYRDLHVEPPFTERVWRVVMDVLGRLFTVVNENRVLALLALLVVAAVFGWFLLWSLRRAGIVGEARVDQPRATDDDIDWDAVAREAEARGDLDAAVRAGFRALVQQLAGRGWVPDRRSLTASEARAAVADRRAGLASAVADATTSFEQVAYARREPGPEDVARVRRALEEVGR